MQKEYIYVVSPLHWNEFYSKRTSVSSVCFLVQQSEPRYPNDIINYIVLNIYIDIYICVGLPRWH